MDVNMSAPRYLAPVPFDNASGMPPYPPPHSLHNQQPQSTPPLNPFGLSNNQRFDANWFANFPPPPPPPPPFVQSVARSSFDSSSAPIFPQIPFIPPTNATSPQNSMLRTETLQERPRTPPKERAKEAILSLVRADITYGDLINEGVKATLLTNLFAELNLPVPKPVADPIQALDPAMERKDRIAKLLAAKRNQNSATASPKESVQSNEAALTPENVSRNQTPVLPPLQVVARETQRSDFSIPGLFLTSAEQEEIAPLRSPSDATGDSDNLRKETTVQNNQPGPVIATQPDVPAQTSTSNILSKVQTNSVERISSPPSVASIAPKSLKRGPELFSSNVMPQPKRQISTSQDVLPIRDPIKAADNAVSAVRSKVNQNILKDRMAALKADLLLKNSRKQALQDGMPVLNAEVQKTREHLQDNQSRLQNIRGEIDRKTNELVRLKEDESRLSEEVQRLERQLADGETGQQQFSYELTELNDQIMADEKESRLPQALSSPIVAHTEGLTKPTLLLNEEDYRQPKQVYPDTLSEENTDDKEALVITKDRIPQTETEYSPEQDAIDRQLNDQATYHTGQTLVTAMDPSGIYGNDNGTGSQQLSAMTTPYEVDSDQNTDDERMSIDEASEEDSVASASMSDSGSDEYEPPINLDTPDELEKDVDDYEPQEATVELNDSPEEAENDDYEPSEQVRVLNVENLEEMRQADDQLLIPPSANPHVGDVSSETHVPPSVADVTTDFQPSELPTPLAPAPELTIAEQLAVTLPKPLSNPRESIHSAPRFVPYSSPLSNTRQFRFNPQFNDLVKSGYRSLTYSHQIDKDVPLCPTELSGAMCCDVDCEEQHFGKFALTDDKILVQMSSANHIKDKAQRDGYLIGLKKVIADLRERGVKEFSEVANALAKYRREQAMAQSGLFA